MSAYTEGGSGRCMWRGFTPPFRGLMWDPEFGSLSHTGIKRKGLDVSADQPHASCHPKSPPMSSTSSFVSTQRSLRSFIYLCRESANPQTKATSHTSRHARSQTHQLRITVRSILSPGGEGEGGPGRQLPWQP